jgi:hypothetical protein
MTIDRNAGNNKFAQTLGFRGKTEECTGRWRDSMENNIRELGIANWREKTRDRAE